MITSKPLLAFAALAIVCSTTVAQQPKPEPSQKYLLLGTVQTGTMQKELDAAAAQGYRVVVGSPTSSAEMAILLERSPEAGKYQYKLLATTRTGTMEKELNQAAADGYRLLARTMISKKGVLSQEVVSVLEREPASKTRYRYKLLATTLTSTLQREMEEAKADGYVLAGLVSRGEHMVIMEKEITPAGE